MKQSDLIMYIVEGPTEKKLIDNIKNNHILSGKVYVKNLAQNGSIETILKMIKPKTHVIIVFDTDLDCKNNFNCFCENIEKIKKCKNTKNIILIPQISNLEDELIFSTNIKTIKEFTKSKSNKEFKTDFLAMTDSNIPRKLIELKFDINQIWSRTPKNIYKKFKNDAATIKNK